MSQNKTVVPESEYDLHHTTYSDMGPNSDFYRPSGASVNSTVIAGTDISAAPPAQSVTSESTPAVGMTSDEARSRCINVQERVIIGCLFSISRGLLGEIFPIYLGRNMIGSSSTCDITLKEGSVSDEHAVLYVRCDDYPGNCTLSITDYGSYYGTSVNQKDCRYETLTVMDGDQLTIGRHYRLIVNLFEAAKHGLYEDCDFEDSDSSANDISSGSHQAQSFYSPSRLKENDSRTVIG